jgi:hypothetical protein
MSLVEKHKDLKGKVNTQSWRIFLLQVPQHRQRAAYSHDTDGKWGLKDEQEGDQMARPPSNILPPSLPVSKKELSQPAALKNQKSKKKKPYVKVLIKVCFEFFSALQLISFSLLVQQTPFLPRPLLPSCLRLRTNCKIFMTLILHKGPHHQHLAMPVLGILLPLLFTLHPLTLLFMLLFPMRCSHLPLFHLTCFGIVPLEGAPALILLTCVPLQMPISRPSMQLSLKMKSFIFWKRAGRAMMRKSIRYFMKW